MEAYDLSMRTSKPLLQLELRPVEAPSYATPGARVFMLLPALEDLLALPPGARLCPIQVRIPRFMHALPGGRCQRLH